MTINQRIIAAVTPVVPICKPEVYIPPDDQEQIEEIYCTFEVDEDPISGDNLALISIFNCAVHLFAPYHSLDGKSVNTIGIRQQLKTAIASAEDFSIPSIEDDSDAFGQHFVFQFQAV